DFGTANPVGGSISWSIARGVSQSGNYLRGWLHLGFNQNEAGRRVHDGMWPIIAGRRVALNFRWAQPDGVLELYQAGSEGPQWWADWPDHVRHRDFPRESGPAHADGQRAASALPQLGDERHAAAAQRLAETQARRARWRRR